MPKSTTSTPSGSPRPASRRTTSTPKPSSPRNTFPTPATRTRPLLTIVLRVQRYDLFGGEEEPVSEGGAILSEVPARVILQRDRQVDPVLVVLLDGLDESYLAGEREVHDVPSGARPEHDPAPLLELDTLDDHALKLGSSLLLPEEVHPSPSASGTPGWPRVGSLAPLAREPRLSPGSPAPAGRRRASPLSPRP